MTDIEQSIKKINEQKNEIENKRKPPDSSP